ncbi:MAG: hypothetical protein AB1760_00145 [Pseudomonadota bacterium]
MDRKERYGLVTLVLKVLAAEGLTLPEANRVLGDASREIDDQMFEAQNRKENLFEATVKALE